MKINNFKTFDQFLIYIKQNSEEMKYWDDVKAKEFCDRVSTLMEESPEFKEKYDEWGKRVELQVKAKEAKIKIGGTVEQTAFSKAYLRLKEIQKEKQKRKEKSRKTPKTTNQLKQGGAIEI